MSCGTVVEINVGGPAPLNVVGARQGSRWLLPLTFSEDLSLSDLTAASIALVSVSDPGADPITITGDIAQKASGVVTFTAAKALTTTIPAGAYLWEIEFTAPADERLDGWSPLAGSWTVIERRAA